MAQQYPPEVLQAAQQYREYLTTNKIARFGNADRMVDQKFGKGVAAIINPHKSGGFSKIGGAVGDVTKKVAPFAALIPGVGALAAAGLTAAGAGLGKLNDQGGLGGTKVLKEIGLPAAGAYVAGKGMEKVAGGVGGGTGILGDGRAGGIWDDIKATGGNIMDLAKGVDVGDLLKAGAAGAGIYSTYKGAKDASKDSARSRQLTEDAIARAHALAARGDAEFAANAPLRDAYRSGALNFGDPTNPFRRALPGGK